MLAPGPDGLHHPASEDEVVALVREARARGLRVRVHGARHSEPAVIGTEAWQAGRAPGACDVRLDRLNRVEVDAAARQVWVEAGCRLGADPREEDLDTAFDRSLAAALDAAGLALPMLGGVSHQTVGGFLMTGSAGGSVKAAFTDALLSIRFVDGQGEVHEWDRGEPRFHALAVSFGLLGIVTAVRLACVDRYDLVGGEQALAGDALPFDRRADGAAGLEGFLREQEFARVLWWPQPGVDRWVLWTGRRAPCDGVPRRPYQVLPPVLGSTILPQAAGGLALRTIARRPWWLGPPLRAALFKLFVPLDPAPRPYADRWFRAIPMDDGIEETLLPTRFTELWLPLTATGEVLRRLEAEVRTHGEAAAGQFALELYAAPANEFWASPGYRRDSLRLNWFWFDRAPGNPSRTFFPRFWSLFADLQPRFHWGKLMPEPGHPAAVAMRASLPRLPELLAEREARDPDGLFLTDPWRSRLGLPAPPEPAELPPFVAGGRRALWWPMAEAGLGLVGRAQRVVAAEAEVAASAEDAYRLIEGFQDNEAFVLGYRGADHLDPSLPPHRRRIREKFWFMTLDLRVVAAEPGRRWAAAVTAASLPLASALTEVFDFEALGPGRSRIRWRLLLDPLPGLRWAVPLVLPLVRWWLRAMLRRLQRHLEAAPPRRGG